MKKIIDGKLYNTDTSKLLCKWLVGEDNGGNVINFYELYLTKKGTYFKATFPGHSIWSDGDNIEILSEADARKTMEEHSSAEEYISAFGDVEEG